MTYSEKCSKYLQRISFGEVLILSECEIPDAPVEEKIGNCAVYYTLFGGFRPGEVGLRIKQRNGEYDIMETTGAHYRFNHEDTVALMNGFVCDFDD